MIKRDELHRFIDKQIDHIESKKTLDEMYSLGKEQGLTTEQTEALWLAAGIAALIGAYLMMDGNSTQFVEDCPEVIPEVIEDSGDSFRINLKKNDK